MFTLCIDLFHARVLGQGFTPTRQKPAMMLIPGQVHSVAVASGAATTTKKRRTRKRRKGKGRPAAAGGLPPRPVAMRRAEAALLSLAAVAHAAAEYVSPVQKVSERRLDKYSSVS